MRGLILAFMTMRFSGFGTSIPARDAMARVSTTKATAKTTATTV